MSYIVLVYIVSHCFFDVPAIWKTPKNSVQFLLEPFRIKSHCSWATVTILFHPVIIICSVTSNFTCMTNMYMWNLQLCAILLLLHWMVLPQLMCPQPADSYYKQTKQIIFRWETVGAALCTNLWPIQVVRLSVWGLVPLELLREGQDGAHEPGNTVESRQSFRTNTPSEHLMDMGGGGGVKGLLTIYQMIFFPFSGASIMTFILKGFRNQDQNNICEAPG